MRRNGSRMPVSPKVCEVAQRERAMSSADPVRSALVRARNVLASPALRAGFFRLNKRAECVRDRLLADTLGTELLDDLSLANPSEPRRGGARSAGARSTGYGEITSRSRATGLARF